jgi:hypothetical protein
LLFNKGSQSFPNFQFYFKIIWLKSIGYLRCDQQEIKK